MTAGLSRNVTRVTANAAVIAPIGRWPFLKPVAHAGVMSFDIGGSAVASKAEEYRAKAAECDQRAASIRDAKVKAQYQELARQWRELAKQADHMIR
jgi:hypothetical protein